MGKQIIVLIILCIAAMTGCQQAPAPTTSRDPQTQQALATPTTAADCEQMFEALLSNPVCTLANDKAHQQGAHRMKDFGKVSPMKPMTAPPTLSFDPSATSSQVTK